jgi:hypothetical protein
MAGQVLSTDTGKQAITQMKGIINGGLLDQISQLVGQGNILSDPGVWDGPKAVQFRDSWSSISRELTEAQGKLNELAGQVDGINAEIMSAGGA